MTKQEFDKILIEEGIDSKSLRGELWESRRSDDLDKDRVRATAKVFKVLHGESIARRAQEDKHIS